MLTEESTSQAPVYLIRVGLYDNSITGGTNEETYPIKIAASSLNVTVEDFFIHHCKTTFANANGKTAINHGLSACIATGLDHTGIVAKDVIGKHETLAAVWNRFTKFSRFIFKINGEKKKKSSGAKAQVNSDKGPRKKRGPSAYIIFCKAKRPLIAAANPSAGFGQIGKLLGQAWAKLDQKVIFYLIYLKIITKYNYKK